MCLCNQKIRSPWCGKSGCQPPHRADHFPDAGKMVTEPAGDLVERVAYAIAGGLNASRDTSVAYRSTVCARAVLALFQPRLDAAEALLRVVVEDVLTHRGSWVDLLEKHAESLPPDIMESADVAGTCDKSYAKHEANAAKRDLGLLADAANRASAAGLGVRHD